MHEIISLQSRKATSLSYDLVSQMLSDQTSHCNQQKYEFTFKLCQRWVQTFFYNLLSQLFTLYDLLLRGD